MYLFIYTPQSSEQIALPQTTLQHHTMPEKKTVVAYSVFHHDQKHWLWTWTWLCWAKYQRALQRSTFSEPPLLTSTFNYPLTCLHRETVYLWMSISPTTHMLHCGYAISPHYYYLSPKRSLVLCSLLVVVSKEKGSSRYDSSRLFGSTTPVPPQHHHHHLATCLLLNAATNRWCSIRLHSNLGGTVATLVPVVFVVKRHVMSRQSKNFSISSRWPRWYSWPQIDWGSVCYNIALLGCWVNDLSIDLKPCPIQCQLIMADGEEEGDGQEVNGSSTRFLLSYQNWHLTL